MNRFYIFLLISSLITGCTHPTKHQEQLEIKQTYIVEWIGEFPLIDFSHLTIELGENNRASGFAGCNNWHGNYSLQNQKIKFTNIATTRKLCSPALMHQEQQFIEALPTVERWDFSEVKQLRLWPNKGQPIRLWAQDIN